MRRKNTFRPEFDKLDGVKRSRIGDGYFFCEFCNKDINLETMGKAAITAHQNSTTHKDAVRRKATNRTIEAFVQNKAAPSSTDLKTAAAEGCWAYHTVRHHQSFASNDCVSSDGLFKSMFSDSKIAEKYSSAQKKTAAIIKGVLAPYSTQLLLKELANLPFSLCIDASNHAETKLVPLVVRFFSAKGIQTRLLDLTALPGETAQQLNDWICSALEKHGLQIENLVALCADNAPTNFGRPENLREGREAHILHNAAKRAANQLPLDLEAVSFKLASYFRGSTLRNEQFRTICEEFETNFNGIPSHGATRWTTLAKVIDKMLLLWEPLKQLFSAPEKPRFLRDFFHSEEAEPICHFLQNVLKVFEIPILALQKNDLILPDLLEIMANFKAKIEERLNKKFFGGFFALRRLNPTLRADFCNFYQIVINYVDQWFQLQSMPRQIEWINLNKREVDWATNVAPLAEQICPEIALSDELFDEVSQLNQVLKEIPEEELNRLKPEQKWRRIFQSANGVESFKNLHRIVSAILSIPVSNAFIERVFSLENVQWTKERNLLQVDTVKSILLILVNFDMSCTEMHKMLLGNEKLLKQIVANEKYG